MMSIFTKKTLSVLSFFLCLIASSHSFGQIAITDSATANQLVANIVGSGIGYSNAVLKCTPNAVGLFTVTNSNLGLTGGIILTTGYAETDLPNGVFGADGAQNIGQASFQNEPDPNNPINDPDLDTLVTVGTHDACVLEFDFVPDGDSLSFNYVFGSEEYDNYSCSNFNDVFGFFLSGPGITGAPNIALIPGTNIPVAINSTTDTAITKPNSTTDCLAMGSGSPFAQYYNDNQNGTSINYYGLTKVLTARAVVIPCSTYHIKLAIADGGDGILDSGVFLEQNSFKSNNISISLESSLDGKDYLVEGCSEGTIRVKRTLTLPVAQTIYLSYTGSATYGTDYNAPPDTVVIPVGDTVFSYKITAVQDNSTEGTENIVINVLNPCTQEVSDSIVIPVLEFLEANLLSDDTALCADNVVRLEVAGDTNFTYEWTANPPVPIEDPFAMRTFSHPNISTTYTVRGKYEDCYSEEFSFDALVEPNPLVDIFTEDTIVCINRPMKILASVAPDNYEFYTYTWSPAAGLNDTSILEPEFFVTKDGIYTYVLSVTTEQLKCEGKDAIVIDAKPGAELTDVTADFVATYGEEAQLYANGVSYYIWTPSKYLDYPNKHNPKVIEAIEPVTFMVIGINEYNCFDTAYVKMDIDFTMREMMPTAFTPNGDGNNDLFRVINLKHQKLIEFRIFNRWGQEIFATTNPDEGWNGSYSGIPQEMGVYHYIVRVAIPDGTQRVYKGDVTLVR